MFCLSDDISFFLDKDEQVMWSESSRRRRKKQLAVNSYAFDNTFQYQAASGRCFESQYPFIVPIYQA